MKIIDSTHMELSDSEKDILKKFAKEKKIVSIDPVEYFKDQDILLIDDACNLRNEIGKLIQSEKEYYLKNINGEYKEEIEKAIELIDKMHIPVSYEKDNENDFLILDVMNDILKSMDLFILYKKVYKSFEVRFAIKKTIVSIQKQENRKDFEELENQLRKCLEEPTDFKKFEKILNKTKKMLKEAKNLKKENKEDTIKFKKIDLKHFQELSKEDILKHMIYISYKEPNYIILDLERNIEKEISEVELINIINEKYSFENTTSIEEIKEIFIKINQLINGNTSSDEVRQIIKDLFPDFKTLLDLINSNLTEEMYKTILEEDDKSNSTIISILNNTHKDKRQVLSEQMENLKKSKEELEKELKTIEEKNTAIDIQNLYEEESKKISYINEELQGFKDEYTKITKEIAKKNIDIKELEEIIKNYKENNNKSKHKDDELTLEENKLKTLNKDLLSDKIFKEQIEVKISEFENKIIGIKKLFKTKTNITFDNFEEEIKTVYENSKEQIEKIKSKIQLIDGKITDVNLAELEIKQKINQND